MGVSRRGQQAWGLPLPLEGATNNTQIGTLGTGTPNRYRKLSPQLREGEIPRPPPLFYFSLPLSPSFASYLVRVERIKQKDIRCGRAL